MIRMKAVGGLNKCDFTFHEILTFFGAPYFLGVFKNHMTICLVSGPSPLTFQNIKNHEKGDAERGEGGQRTKHFVPALGLSASSCSTSPATLNRKRGSTPKSGFRFQVSWFRVV